MPSLFPSGARAKSANERGVASAPAGNARRHSRRLSGIVGLIFAVTASDHVSSADWRQIAVDGDDNRYSVDAGLIRTQGTRIKAVVRADYTRPRTIEGIDAPVYAAVDRLVVDCDALSFALEYRAYVSAQGEEIPAVAHDRDALQFRAAPPGSMAATLVSYLCNPASRSRGD